MEHEADKIGYTIDNPKGQQREKIEKADYDIIHQCKGKYKAFGNKKFRLIQREFTLIAAYPSLL